MQVQNIFFPRLDYQVNDKNHVSVSFNWGDYKSPSGYAGGPSYSNTSVTTNGTAYYHERFLVGNWTSQITSFSVNQFLFQWGRDLETAGTNAPGPSVSLSNLQTYGMPNALPRTAEPDENRYQFTDIWSTTRGRHTLKAGGDVNLIHEVMINLFQGGGIYNYSGTTALANFQNWAVDVYGSDGSSAPLAGRHYSSFTQVYDPITKVGKDDFWMKIFDGFVEDTWKVTPTLTFNLGVRYDLQLTPQPPQPNKSSELAAYYTQQLKTVKDRVLPRMGLAWTPQPGTVVRAGYGIFGALTQGSTYYAMRVENGVYQTSYSFNSRHSSAGAPSFPNLLFTPPGPASQRRLMAQLLRRSHPVEQRIVTSFHGLDPNFVPPIAHEYELGVEQAAPRQADAQYGICGNACSAAADFYRCQHRTSYHTRATMASTTRRVLRPACINVPFYTTRKDPTNGSINTGFSVVNSWYNAMAVTLKRPFDHGFQMLLNYTWAKAIDSGQVGRSFRHLLWL